MRGLTSKVAVIAALLLSLGSVAGASGAPGDLDPSFGSGGLVVTPGGGANGLAIQADGKLVTVGASVARYNLDGSLDMSFGTGGQVFDGASAVAVQTDGKIVTAGKTAPGGYCCQFLLARYNANGSLDTSFGSGGKVATVFGGDAEAAAVAIQPDGKIVAVGWKYDPFSPGLAIARYLPNGDLDPSFGTAGKVMMNFGGYFDLGTAVALQSNGTIVVAGRGGPTNDFLLARLNTDGSLDTSFGTGGRVTTDFGGYDGANGVAIQSNGQIVAAGIGGERFALARYNADGSLDTTFGTGGKVTTQFTGQNIEQANALTIQSNGKIVAAGRAFNNFAGDFAIVRYNTDGSLDASFGTGGQVMTDFGDRSNDTAQAVAIQADGKIVAAGGGGACTPSCQIELARYEGDLVDTTPPDATKPTVTISRPVDWTVYPLDRVVSAAFKCVDTESGLASCVGTQSSGANPLVSGVTNLDNSTLGPHQVTVTGTDRAGNVRAAVSRYTVVYTWNGFFSPIGNESDSSLNLVHAGDLIKIGFGLNGDRGLGVLSSLASVPVACPAWAPHTVPAAGAGATAGLAYGVSSAHYTYGWQTSAGWAGTCRQFQMQLNDGTQAHTAVFMFFA